MILTKPIMGQTVRLADCDIGDAEFTLKLRQDPEITKYMPYLDIDIVQQRQWIDGQRDSDDSIFLIIWDIETDTRIGTISVYNIQGNTGEFGRVISIGKKGRASEALRLIKMYSREELELDSLICYIYADNHSSIKYHINNGFKIIENTTDSDGREIVWMRCDLYE